MSFLGDIGGFLKKAVGSGESMLGINNGPTPAPAAATPAPAPQAPSPIHIASPGAVQQPQINIATPDQIPTFSYKITPPPTAHLNAGVATAQPQGLQMNGQSYNPDPNAVTAGAPPPPPPHASIFHDITHNPVTNVVGNYVVKPAVDTAEKSYHTLAGFGAGVGGLARASADAISGNGVAEQNAINQTNAAMNAQLKKSFITPEEAQNADLFGNAQQRADFIRPVVRGSTAIAPYVVPGAQEGGGVVAKLLTPAATFAAVNAGGTAANEAMNGGIHGGDVLKSAAMGGAGGLVGGGIGLAKGGAEDLAANRTPLDERGSIGPGDEANLEKMAQNNPASRPNGDINTNIEKIMNTEQGDRLPPHDFAAQAIAEAQKLPPEDAASMLRSLNVGGTNIGDTFYKVGIDPATSKIVTSLKDPNVDPMKMTPDEVATKAGLPPEKINRTKLSGKALDKTNKQLQEPAMADEVKSGKTKNFNEGAFGPEDQKFLQKQLDLGDLGQGKLSPEEYAQKYNITPMQAEKDFMDMAKDARAKQNISAENLDRFGPPLSIAQRRELIATDPNQATFNQVPLDVPEGNTKGAIAQATGIIAERDSRFNEAERLGAKLSDHDKDLLYRYDNGESIENLAKEADNPEAFMRAADAATDALDYSLAADRAAGGTTLRQQSYMPHYYQATPEEMDKLGIPENQRVKVGKVYKGYRDDSAKYPSYIEAAKHGLKPLYDNLFDAMKEYNGAGRFKIQNQLLATALAKSDPDEIGTLDTVRGPNGDRFTQAAGKLPFAASDRINKNLAAFKDAWQPNSKTGQIALKVANEGNKGLKKSLFFLTPFHYANETAAYAGTTIFTHPITFVKGMANALFSQVGGYNHIIDAARNDGTLEWARLSGLPIKDAPTEIKLGKLNVVEQSNIKLGQFGNTLMLQMARWAKDQGIDPRSELGVQVAAEYGKVIGNMNEAVQGIDPNMSRIFSQGALAPYWLRTRLGLVKDALDYSSLHATGKTGIGLGNPGDIARSAVLGQRALEAGMAIVGSAIAMGAMPTVSQMISEAGLRPNNPVPNIQGNAKNKKGEQWLQEFPTDPIGVATTAVTDPQHFASSRYAPLLSAASRFATNKDWNGQPLADPNAPNYELKRTEGALKGFLPISLQNATNPNISIKQGLLEDVGMRYKVNPDDPQAKANTNYYNAFNQTSNQLKQSGPYGQYWAQQFANLHPQNTTDASGNKYPTPYNPSSSDAKYAAYTTVNQKGQQVLSPVFYADQKLNQLTPGYPHSPLYDLSGNGTDVSGNAAPKALVAMQYQHAQDPAAKTDIMNANGGQNGWLASYENQVGDYSKNYQQNLTNYFQKLGWTPNAINDYWSKHPSTPDPIDQVNFDTPTQNAINQYYSLQASGDSTAASQYFSQNANVLGPAFDQLAQHANALRAAKGELQLQGYPAEPDHVKQILDSMPSGSDPASKKARAQLINGNPDVSQYLTDIALYETLAKGAQFRYQLPGNMQATEAQNINNGGQAGQTFMKDVSSLAKYGIAFNPTTNSYSIIQNGAAPAGSTVGGGIGLGKSYKKKPKLYLARTNLRNRHIKLHSTRKIGVAYASRPGRVYDEGKVRPVKLGGGVNDSSIRLV